MTLLKPYALGADGQVIPGRLMRLALGSAFRPAAAGVSAISGILYGPANTMGEGSLLSAVLLRINPFTAVIQGTQQGTQGQYVVPNDAAVDLAVLGQHASQYRRLMAVVRVADSQIAGVASTALTDNSFLELLDGGLSALNPPPLPALPDNALAIGEVLVPPVGQAVTWTPYNPRTTTRGGILPVINDASTITGHAGQLPGFDGQYRDHPNYGLQRGHGASNTWRPGDPGRISALIEGVAVQTITTGTSPFYVLLETAVRLGGPPTLAFTYNAANGRLTAQYDGWYLASGGASWSANATGRRLVALWKNGVQIAQTLGGTVSVGTSNTYAAPTASYPVFLAAGDYLQLVAFQDSGVSLNINRNSCFLHATWIGL